MPPATIRQTVTLPASPGEVFAALCHSKAIAAWSGQKGKVELKVGGRIHLFDGWVKGRVLGFKPGKSLTYTWITEDWEKGTEASIVTYTFTRSKSGTKVQIIHKKLPTKEEARKHREGWKEFVFDPLRKYFQRKKKTR